MKRVLLLSSFVLCSLAFASLADDAAALRLKISSGDKFEQTTVTDSHTEMNGQDMSGKTTTVQTYDFGDVKDGWQPVTIRTTKYDMKMNSDLAGVDPDELAKAMSKVVISGEVSALGEMRNVKGENLPDGPMGAAAASGLKIMELIGLGGISFPDKTLAKGDTWAKSIDMGALVSASSGGMVDAKETKLPYTFEYQGKEMLDGVETAKIGITLLGDVTIDVPAAGGSGTVHMDVKSTAWVSLENGVPYKTETKSKTQTKVGQIEVSQNVDATSVLKKL